MKSKTVEQLTNVEIDLLAAKVLFPYGAFIRTSDAKPYPHVWARKHGLFNPTGTPVDTQRLIEEARISFKAPHGDSLEWEAYIKGDTKRNPTERRAIVAKKKSFYFADAVCRCFIASKYGRNISDKELHEK